MSGCATCTEDRGTAASLTEPMRRSDGSMIGDGSSATLPLVARSTGMSSGGGASLALVPAAGRAGGAFSRPTLSLVPRSPGARFAGPRKRLVAALRPPAAKPGLQRQYQATRLVVDDFGDAVAVERRCYSCKRWGTQSAGMCPACQRWARVRRARERDPVVERERRSRKRRELMARYPDARERERERFARNRRLREERDPEGEREKNRERNARYHERVRADPGRHLEKKESARIDKAIRRGKADGAMEATKPRLNGTGSAPRGQNVPAAPLVRAILCASVRWLHGVRSAPEQVGISDRLVRTWQAGPHAVASWDSADRVLVGLGRFWWEMFDPADGPHGLFSSVRARDVVAWIEAAQAAADLWDAYRGVGDRVRHSGREWLVESYDESRDEYRMRDPAGATATMSSGRLEALG